MDEVIAEAVFYGRARDQSTAVQVTLNFSVARVHTVMTTVGGVNIKLQSARQLQKGGPIGYVVNAGANAFNLVDNSSGALTTLDPGECVELGLLDNTTAAGTWIVLEGTANFVAAPPVNLRTYLIGGSPSGGGSPNKKKVREYDTYGDVWTAKSDIHASLFESLDAAVAVNGSKGFLFGVGSTGSSADQVDCAEYDPDTWTMKTANSHGTEALAAISVGAVVFTFNGVNPSTDQYKTDEYAVSGDSWTSKTIRPSGRRSDRVCAGFANSKAVLIDGNVNACDTYVSDTWTAKTTRPGADARMVGTASSSNVVYCYGGYNFPTLTYIANVYTYTEASDSWAALLNMPVARRDIACSNIGGFNYLICGREGPSGGSGNESSKNYEHTIAGDTYLLKTAALGGVSDQNRNTGQAITP